MGYSDNTKGFRRRNVITKLDALLQDLAYAIEYIQDVLNHDNDWMMDEEYNQWVYELEDLEHHYSCVRTTYCLMVKGSRVSKHDLIYCNDIRKTIK
tara:strand:+ start:43 stop:330 length:288 start_codon:yes stop_codon:yes gene_type:complete